MKLSKILVGALITAAGLSALGDCLKLPVNCSVTSAFGPRYDPVARNFTVRVHSGVDFGCPIGTPVTAATSGTATSFVSAEGGSMVEITSDDRQYKYGYLHNSSFDPAIIGGRKVSAGQQVALSGNSGSRTTGPHLHFQSVDVSKGARKAFDPMPHFCTAPKLRSGVLQGATSSAPAQGTASSAPGDDAGDEFRQARKPGDNEGTPPKMGLDAGLNEIMADLIASRSLNPDYMTQLATLSTPRLYAELAYMQTIDMKLKNERNIHKERINAMQAMMQALRTEAVLKPQMDAQRSAATSAAAAR